jgi:hypothetical protein
MTPTSTPKADTVTLSDGGAVDEGSVARAALEALGGEVAAARAKLEELEAALAQGKAGSTGLARL